MSAEDGTAVKDASVAAGLGPAGSEGRVGRQLRVRAERRP